MKSGTAAIIGRPNSGKSTLLNALIGQKISIVSANPQTTRYRILGIHTEPRGQIVFVDTPGIHRPNYRMNERMQHAVSDSLSGIDLVLLVVDGSIAFGGGEAYVLEMVQKARARTILLINKIDKFAKPKLLPIMKRYGEAYEFLEIIPISALKADNLDVVVEKIFACLPQGEPLYDPELVTDRSERFLAAEFIREKILARTREELPYCTAVLVNQFDESQRETKNLVVIEADILVEKRSQQGIILGAGGTQLRQLGTDARKDLETLLGCKVYLALTVRTSSRWRDDESVLNQLEVGT